MLCFAGGGGGAPRRSVLRSFHVSQKCVLVEAQVGFAGFREQADGLGS